MSQDDIVFDEIRYREPQKLRRPDRDRRWACLAYEVPGPADMPVFLDRKPADAIERHALRDTGVELGGILLGRECVDDQTGQPFVWVTQALEAKHYENTQASFTYTHDSWEEITRERDAKHPDLDVVGWYHTHPDFGVFLSGHDLFIQRHFFGQPLQVAYVVDPVRQTRAFFQWRDGAMDQVGGFYLSAERGDRLALARFVHDLENLPPTADAGGSGISPRLEAELIAMLSRQTAHHSPPAADRTLNAALFGTLGILVGMVGLAAVLWLHQLNGLVLDQSRTIQELDRTAREAADRQHLALDLALGDRPGGTDPERFVAQYARAARERDEAQKRLTERTTVNDLLAARTQALTDELSKVKADYKELRTAAEHDAADAKEAPELRSRLERLARTNAIQSARIDDLTETLDTAEGRKAAELRRNYSNAWYAAAIGWAVSVALGLALVAHAFRQPESPGPESPPSLDIPPTHRIS